MPYRNWFKDWFSSPYYYKLYQNRDESEANAFIETLIQYLNPKPGSRMLDVACGRGRHSKALADMGFDVTGIDISLPSIEEAKQNENEHLQFFLHDMRLPFYINYFEYAFNFFTSFGYFRTRREHDDALRTIAQSLKENGLFVIDYLNVHYVENHMERSEVKEVDGYKFQISKWHTEEHFFKQIQVFEPATQTQKHLYTERVAKFSLGDFTEMLAYQHMQVQEVFGDYHLGSYHLYNSPRLIILAKKVK